MGREVKVLTEKVLENGSKIVKQLEVNRRKQTG